MRIIATMMIRDEVDIVSAMVEHHLAQGVDHLIVTDNASVDGTTEVLEEYAREGVLELHHDPVHRKQQFAVVSGMARRARTHFAADWVINADADEFFVPRNRELTLRQVLTEIPLSLGAFTASVTNYVGPPALRGSGLRRLVWRDLRTDTELKRIGVNAHPTPNAIHRGEPDVEVAQGNHFVSIPSSGAPPAELEIEVLHLPWRSWNQLERKVVNAGRGYEANPDLKPSKNHHGMADYRRYKGGRLQYAYHLRSPLPEELHGPSFECDAWLPEHLARLIATAVQPDILSACLDDSKDEILSLEEHAQGQRLGEQFHLLEEQVRDLQRTIEHHRVRVHKLTRDLRQSRQGG